MSPEIQHQNKESGNQQSLTLTDEHCLQEVLV